MLLVACVLLQSAVNAMNDYFDFIKGTDSASDHVEVNDAVLIYGNIAPRSALFLGIAYLVAGAALGLMACRGSGMVPVVIGIIGGIVILLFRRADSGFLSSDRRDCVGSRDGRPYPPGDCGLRRRKNPLADSTLFPSDDSGNRIDHDEQ